jgi:hypothetical protein
MSYFALIATLTSLKKVGKVQKKELIITSPAADSATKYVAYTEVEAGSPIPS